jgi:mycothiol synthase
VTSAGRRSPGSRAAIHGRNADGHIVGTGEDGRDYPRGVLTHRPATTLDDLALAGDLMSRAWLSGWPGCVSTPAGIEWWHAGSWPDELGEHLRLWYDGETPVAWSWHDGDEIEWHAWTGDRDRDLEVFREILETAIADAGGRMVGTWTAEDDEATVGLLGELGFSARGRRLSQWQRHASDGPPPLARLADGYRIRAVAGPADLPERVEVHRSAFAPSRLTVEKYERLTTLPHYRYEDDLVVVAPNGHLAAFAMAWWDPVAGVGEFEPVGTHADHRRRGLARALLTFGLHRFFDMGARTVQVYSDAADLAPETLYESVGFRRRAFHQRYERPATETPEVRSTP